MNVIRQQNEYDYKPPWHFFKLNNTGFEILQDIKSMHQV